MRAQKSPYPLAFARTALRLGLVAAGLRRGDAVLLPEFVCEVIIEPPGDWVCALFITRSTISCVPSGEIWKPAPTPAFAA